MGDIHALYELNTLFGNTATFEEMKKCILNNESEIICIAYSEETAAGFCCGHIVASVCYSEKRADIEALYVKENYRRQGIGKALLSCLEKSFAQRGIYHFHINTRNENKNALKLYQDTGFIFTGEILLEKTAK